jgi:hypothetical protein
MLLKKVDLGLLFFSSYIIFSRYRKTELCFTNPNAFLKIFDSYIYSPFLNWQD